MNLYTVAPYHNNSDIQSVRIEHISIDKIVQENICNWQYTLPGSQHTAEYSYNIINNKLYHKLKIKCAKAVFKITNYAVKLSIEGHSNIMRFNWTNTVSNWQNYTVNIHKQTLRLKKDNKTCLSLKINSRKLQLQLFTVNMLVTTNTIKFIVDNYTICFDKPNLTNFRYRLNIMYNYQDLIINVEQNIMKRSSCTNITWQNNAIDFYSNKDYVMLHNEHKSIKYLLSSIQQLINVSFISNDIMAQYLVHNFATLITI